VGVMPDPLSQPNSTGRVPLRCSRKEDILVPELFVTAAVVNGARFLGTDGASDRAEAAGGRAQIPTLSGRG